MSTVIAIAPAQVSVQPTFPVAVARPPVRRNGRKTTSIPEYLVRETIDGKPFYYRGFREVLNKTATIEDIMADSKFQINLKNEIGDHLKSKIGKKDFRIWVGETGLHLGPKTNMGLDVVVYDKRRMPADQLDGHYADVPAELVVEIDIDIEIQTKSNNLFIEYVMPKTNRLLDFGTKRVVWFFSKERKILVATPTSVRTQDWSEAVELMPGVMLEVEKLIAEAEI